MIPSAAVWKSGRDFCATEQAMANDAVTRFLGGSPGMVLVRLILLSILVGVVLAVIGVDATDILRSLQRLVRSIWDMGWEAIYWLWHYFLLGAAIVVPIWLIIRIFRAPRGR